MNEVINFPVRSERIKMAADDSCAEHPYRTMLTRHYRTRDEAFVYLASRGFLFLPSGWKNGRWMATIERTHHDFFVAIRLPRSAA